MARGLGKNRRGFANSSVTTTVVTTSSGSSNVALYLPFDSDLNDDSTNAFTGTAVNSASISTSVKKFGSGSLDLVSSGKYVNYPYNSDFDLGTHNWTFEAWIYQTTSDDASLFSQGAGGSGGSTDYNYAFKITDGSPRQFQFFWNGGDGHGWSLNPAINVWNHVALVREGNLVHCFLNGVKGSGSANFNVTVRSLGSDNFSVGHSPLAGYRGYIDDFRFIKGIALYTSNFTPPTSAVGLTGGFEVTTTTVENKFLSSVWSLKDQNKKISKGEWIRNDANSGSDAKGVNILGANLQTTGHRWYQAPPSRQPFFDPSLLQSSSTLSNLNKTITNTQGSGRGANYILNSVTSGKYYVELTLNSSNDNSLAVGVVNSNHGAGTGLRGENDSDAFGRRFGQYGPEATDNIDNGDTIGLALDADSKQLDIYVNNTLQSNMSGSFSVTGALFLAVSVYDGNSLTLVDVDSYTYTAPSGYETGWDLV